MRAKQNEKRERARKKLSAHACPSSYEGEHSGNCNVKTGTNDMKTSSIASAVLAVLHHGARSVKFNKFGETLLTSSGSRAGADHDAGPREGAGRRGAGTKANDL